MSYIPDYRKETDKLNDIDRAFIEGFRVATEVAKGFFDNTDMYEVTKEEEKVLTGVKEDFEDWMKAEEVMAVCSLFDKADYDDIDLVDAHKPLYKNTKGAKADGNS